MSEYYCTLCDTNCFDIYTFKRHIATDKHRLSIQNQKIYEECHRKAFYNKKRAANLQNVLTFKNSIVEHNIVASKYDLDLILPKQNEIKNYNIPINIGNVICCLCNKNFIGRKIVVKTDAYLKKFAEHNEVCEGKYDNEAIFENIDENISLTEHCVTLRGNLMKLANNYADLLGVYNNLTKSSDVMAAKIIKLKAKCADLRNQIDTNNKTHTNTLINKIEESSKIYMDKVVETNKLHTDTLITQMDKTVDAIKEITTHDSKPVNIQQIHIGDNYNYIKKNFPDAPAIEQANPGMLQYWFLHYKMRPIVTKLIGDAKYVECLGTLKCDKNAL